MTTISSDLPGEDVIANPSAAHQPTDAVGDLRQTIALNELQQLREDLQAENRSIAELQHENNELRSQISQQSGRKTRGAMSARIGAEDQTTRQRNVDDAAMHATATGKRRDLLSYLRLRRRKT